jgi:hypothetical protein
MAHFVNKSKNPKNFLSNHRLIGLLIRKGMGIPNVPLPKVEEQPNPMPIVMTNLEQLNPIPGPIHEPHPSNTTTFKSPTVTTRKLTKRSKHKTQIKSNTTQKILDKVEPEHIKPIPAVVIELAVDNTILG